MAFVWASFGCSPAPDFPLDVLTPGPGANQAQRVFAGARRWWLRGVVDTDTPELATLDRNMQSVLGAPALLVSTPIGPRILPHRRLGGVRWPRTLSVFGHLVEGVPKQRLRAAGRGYGEKPLRVRGPGLFLAGEPEERDSRHGHQTCQDNCNRANYPSTRLSHAFAVTFSGAAHGVAGTSSGQNKLSQRVFVQAPSVASTQTSTGPGRSQMYVAFCSTTLNGC